MSREVSSRLRSSSSEFGLRLFLFFSIVLQETSDVSNLAADVEQHTEDSIDIVAASWPKRPSLGVRALDVTRPGQTSIR